MTALGPDDDFRSLLEQIARARRFTCSSYKDKCLRRRIAVRMRARGVHSYRDYAALLDADAREYDALIDALTINVTKLFRNWEVWDAIARDVVPAIWANGRGPIRVWSAGCASGEESYSLAALFHRHALRTGDASRAERVSVLGTDIDRASLEAAARGEYPAAAFADTPDEMRRAYFEGDSPATVVPALRRMVRFERRDLIGDAPPPGAFDLIACRNVIIYFDRATQEMLFERFHDALAPGGFLVLGKVETLLGPARHRFAAVDARERIFRRP